jgi:integrase/recombinase XerC
VKNLNTAAIITACLVEMQRRNLRASTIYQRRRVLSRLAAWLDPASLLAATADQLEAWCFRPLSAESQATEVSHVRQFYLWATRQGHLEENPAAELRRPHLLRRLPRPIPEEELWRALDRAPADGRVRPALLLAAWGGLRASEIAQLRAEDLWWRSEPPIIIVNDGKGGHPGTVPLGGFLVDELRRSGLPRQGWLFPRRDGQPGHISGAQVSHLSNRFLHSIGIADTLHALRHRFGTQLLRASGGNTRVAQEGLRHASLQSTQIYTLITPLELATHVERLPGLPPG